MACQLGNQKVLKDLCLFDLTHRMNKTDLMAMNMIDVGTPRIDGRSLLEKGFNNWHAWIHIDKYYI